jgi:MFS family permease
MAVVAPLSGALADRVGSRWLAPVGLSVAAMGLLLLSRLTPTTSIVYVVACLVVTGVGQGLFQSPNATAIMGAAPPDEQGVAAGALATGRVIGQGLSVAVAGAVFTGMGAAAAGSALVTGRRSLGPPQLPALQRTFDEGMRTAFVLCAAFAAVGVMTAFARGTATATRRTTKSDPARDQQENSSATIPMPEVGAALSARHRASPAK